MEKGQLTPSNPSATLRESIWTSRTLLPMLVQKRSMTRTANTKLAMETALSSRILDTEKRLLTPSNLPARSRIPIGRFHRLLRK
jgi:hypothetical protein